MPGFSGAFAVRVGSGNSANGDRDRGLRQPLNPAFSLVLAQRPPLVGMLTGTDR